MYAGGSSRILWDGSSSVRTCCLCASRIRSRSRELREFASSKRSGSPAGGAPLASTSTAAADARVRLITGASSRMGNSNWECFHRLCTPALSVGADSLERDREASEKPLLAAAGVMVESRSYRTAMNGSHHQRLLSITLRDLRAACCPQLAPAAARRAIAQCASTVSRVDSILSAVRENGMHRNYDSDYYCNT